MRQYQHLDTIYFLLKQGDDVALNDDDTYSMQCQIQLAVAKLQTPLAPTKLQRHEAEGTFILPCQLDRTKWEDVYDAARWEEYHKNSISNTHGSKYPCKKHHLSYSRDLSPEVAGVEILATRTSPFGVIPEISVNGARRCIFVAANGRRCKSYTHDGLLCVNHRRYKRALKGYLMANNIYGNMFKNSTLQEMYDDFKKSDARDITAEIAMMRTLLGSALSALPQELDAGKIPIDVLTQIMRMTNLITSAIEKYDRIQQRMGLLITPEQMTKLLIQILDIIKGTLDLKSEQFAVLAEKMSKLSVERQVLDYTVNGDNVVAKYGDEPTEAPEVKFSNRCTRYREDGEVRQVPIEAEIAFHEEQQDYLVATRDATPREMFYTEGSYLPHTTVGGREVEIGDDRDPYCVAACDNA